MRIHLRKIASQVVVITGATSGIGLSTARLLARHGAKLVLVARNDSALAQLADELNQQTHAIYIAADVADKAVAAQVANQAIARFGRMDTWINNAGIGMFGRNEEVSVEDMRQVFETNFWGLVYGSLAAVPHLKREGGTLINIGSGFSDRAAPLQGIYSASKHAVKGFTDSLRVELAEQNVPVSVTLIKPSSINSMFIPHARNYMEVEPRLPPPVYSPDIVAKAILYAAEHPKREMYVGGAAKLLGMGAYYLPGMVDKGMKYLMFRLQRTDHAPSLDHQHNLYQPGKDLLESRPATRRVRETSLYTSAITHPRIAKVLLLGSVLALAVYLQRVRNRVP